VEECDVFVNGRSNGIGAVRCSPSIVKTGRLHGRDCVGRFRVMGESGVAVGYRPYRLAVRPVDVLIVDDCQVCAGCEGLTKARQNEAGIHPMEAGATYDQPVGRIERRILCSTGNPPDAGRSRREDCDLRRSSRPMVRPRRSARRTRSYCAQELRFLRAQLVKEEPDVDARQLFRRVPNALGGARPPVRGWTRSSAGDASRAEA